MKDEFASSRPRSNVSFPSACAFAKRASESVEVPPKLSAAAGAVSEVARSMRLETASTVLAVIARITWGSTDSMTALPRSAISWDALS